MAKVDARGCFHDESNGRYISKTDAIIFNKLCDIFDIDPSSKGARARLKKALYRENERIRNRPSIVQAEGKFIFLPTPTPTRRSVRVPPRHFARLRVMWSDYHLGTYKPIEKNGRKYFNLDNTLYITEGEHPWFKVTEAITFADTFKFEQYLKELYDNE